MDLLPFLPVLIGLAGCKLDPRVAEDRRSEPRSGSSAEFAAGPWTAADFDAPPMLHEARTGGGTYRVAWRSLPDPIPQNEPFRLLVKVERVDGRETPEDLVVQAGAWMPAHQHGMLRVAHATRVAGGRFVVEGLLLHMSGEWVLNVDVTQDSKLERARFEVALLPPAATETLAGFDADEIARILTLSPLPPPPDDPTNAHDTDAAAAELGRALFFEARLSGSGRISCATCHVPELDWTDKKPLADVGAKHERHTPSLWNAAYGRWFFWDGRADSLWSQALHPLEGPREMDGDRTSLVRSMMEDARLRSAYSQAFGDLPRFSAVQALARRAKPVPDAPDDPLAQAWSALTSSDQEAIDVVFANAGKALAAFERKIVSGPAPFDDFVAGLRAGDPARMNALSPPARRGLKTFVGKGNCYLCHSGPTFSDGEFHNNRVPTRAELPLDLGRARGLALVRKDEFNGLGRFSDGQDQDVRDKLLAAFVTDVGREFKTPGLRNVARTAPYMHQGQLETLRDVVDFYSDRIPAPSPHGGSELFLVPLHLSAQEKDDLVAFLESLSDAGTLDDSLRQPAHR